MKMILFFSINFIHFIPKYYFDTLLKMRAVTLHRELIFRKNVKCRGDINKRHNVQFYQRYRSFIDVVWLEDSHAIRPSQDNLRDSRILPLPYGPLGDRADGKRRERDAREEPGPLSFPLVLPLPPRARPDEANVIFFTKGSWQPVCFARLPRRPSARSGRRFDCAK